MQAGAFDFITKPWNNLTLMQRIGIALELNGNSSVQKKTVTEKTDFDRSLIIGHSEALENVLEIVRRVAATNAPVLITGENGTGKELVAETISQKQSACRKDPLLRLIFGGISQSLFESEMFGHRNGGIY